MHYYSFDIGNYRGDTTHLKPLEHYIYRTLIDWYYYDEKPIESENNPMVIRRLNLQSEPLAEAMLLAVLGDFFVKMADGWHHKRIDAEIEAYKGKSVVNSENGKKGGRPTKKATKQNPNETEPKPKITQSVNFANPTESDGKANESDLKPNHKSIINNQESLINSKSTIPSEPENVPIENLDELEGEIDSRKKRFSELCLTEIPEDWKATTRRKWAAITDERLNNEFISFENFYGRDDNRNRMNTPNDWKKMFIGSIAKNLMSRPLEKPVSQKTPKKSIGEEGKTFFGISQEAIESNAMNGESYFETAKRLHEAKGDSADKNKARSTPKKSAQTLGGYEFKVFLMIQKIRTDITESMIFGLADSQNKTTLQILNDLQKSISEESAQEAI